MKKILFLFCLCFLFIKFSEAQITFQKTFGVDWDEGFCIQHTFDGYIITGNTHYSPPGVDSFDVSLIKIDFYGNIVWSKRFGGLDKDWAYSLQQTIDSGFIITGRTESFGAGNSDIYLIKTNANGDILWNRTFGDVGYDEGYSVIETNDSGYVITGVISNAMVLIKTNFNGDTLWTRTFDAQRGNCVQQTTDGGLIITGTTHIAGNYDLSLIKTDNNGNLIWYKTIDQSTVGYGDIGCSIQQTIDGGYIIAGISVEPINFYDTNYLIKTDSLGNSQWSKIFGITSYDRKSSVQQTNDSSYIVTGSDYPEIYLLKINSTGNVIWSKTFGTPNLQDESFSVLQTNDNGYLIMGFGEGPYGATLIKTDSIGISGCNEYNFSTTIYTPITLTTLISSQVTTPQLIVGNPASHSITTIINSYILCSSTGKEEIINKNPVNISPNPFTSEISITLQIENVKQATISIKNILGQTVFLKQLQTLNLKLQTSLDLSFLEKGIYLVEVVADGSPDSFPITIGREVRKVVKE